VGVLGPFSEIALFRSPLNRHSQRHCFFPLPYFTPSCGRSPFCLHGVCSGKAPPLTYPFGIRPATLKIFPGDSFLAPISTSLVQCCVVGAKLLLFRRFGRYHATSTLLPPPALLNSVLSVPVGGEGPPSPVGPFFFHIKSFISFVCSIPIPPKPRLIRTFLFCQKVAFPFSGACFFQLFQGFCEWVDSPPPPPLHCFCPSLEVSRFFFSLLLYPFSLLAIFPILLAFPRNGRWVLSPFSPTPVLFFCYRAFQA